MPGPACSAWRCCWPTRCRRERRAARAPRLAGWYCRPDAAMELPAFLSRRRLQFRIVALFLGMLLLVQAASLLLIGSSIGANARASVNAELHTGERVFERLLAQACGTGDCRRIDAAVLRDMRQLTAIEVAVLGRRGNAAPWQLQQTTLGDDDAAALLAGWQHGGDRAAPIELPASGRVLARA